MSKTVRIKYDYYRANVTEIIQTYNDVFRFAELIMMLVATFSLTIC